MFKVDDFLARLASRLEFHKIGRKPMIRIVCLMIAVWLTLLLDSALIELRGQVSAGDSAWFWIGVEFE